MSYATATLRPSRCRGRESRCAAAVTLGAIAQEMSRYAPDVDIRVLGSDGAVTAVFGRAQDDDVTLF